MDMPSNCEDCCFCRGLNVCRLKQCLEKDGVLSVFTVDKQILDNSRPNWCPLRELMEKNVENNKNYEAEIDKLALTIQSKPEVLKMLLRNYDELVKKVYLPEIKEEIKEYPFWNYFYVFDDELLKGEEG